MKKQLLKLSLSILTFLGIAVQSNAQCPSIACPGNITVYNDSLSCGVMVNFSAPVGTDTCNIISQTFSYTGSMQIYVVPAGVTSVTIQADGAQGGSNAIGVVGGLGGTAVGDLTVTPGDTLFVYVGGTNGYNGGGLAGTSPCTNAIGGVGGGASDVRVGGQTLNDRIIVGAGGGGAAGDRISGCGRGTGGAGGGGYYGGGGGASWPYQSTTLPTGGTQTAGGTGGTTTYTSGTNGTAGALGIGGNGGTEVSSSQGGSATALAGGVGGGLTGGIGQYSANWTGQSGAGGSSYIAGLGNSSTTAGMRTGNGQVIISYPGTDSTYQVAGLASGSTFPVGVTTNTFVVANGSFTDTCSFTVTVLDTIAPTISCPSNVVTCKSIVNGISPTFNDNCNTNVTYTLSGSTTGSGNNDASGTSFNFGITTVTYFVADSSGNSDSCSFTVTNNMVDTSITAIGYNLSSNENGATYQWISCPSGLILSGDTNQTYNGVFGGSYAVIVSKNGCTDTSACFTINNVGITNVDFGNITIYPNPTNGLFTIDMRDYDESVNYTLTSIDGRIIVQKSNITDNKIMIDLSNESKGVYLLKLYNTKSSSVFRISRL